MLRKKNVVVVGCGGHAGSLAESIVSHGYNIDYFVDDNCEINKFMDFDVKSKIVDSNESLHIAVAIGDNFTREAVSKKIMDDFPSAIFPKIIHEDASISMSCEIEEGTVILQNAVVGAKTHVGSFCIINSQSSVDHDVSMADYASLGPGVITGGRVNIGKRSAVCIGTVVKHSISIGDDIVVGACSYVNRDCESETVYYGTPARPIRKRHPGDPYLL